MPRAKHLQGDRKDWGGARTGAGRPPGPRLDPGERAQVVSFTLSPGIIKRLTDEAKSRGHSRSMIVEKALREYLSATT